MGEGKRPNQDKQQETVEGRVKIEETQVCILDIFLKLIGVLFNVRTKATEADRRPIRSS